MCFICRKLYSLDITWRPISSKVRVAGMKWKTLWECGTDGVYQFVDEKSSSVSKQSQANDPDIELENADVIFERMKHNVLGGNRKIPILALPGDQPTPLTSSPVAPPSIVAVATTRAGADGTSAASETVGGGWASFSFQASAPAAVAKAKAEPKPKATKGQKRKGESAGVVDMNPSNQTPVPEEKPKRKRKDAAKDAEDIPMENAEQDHAPMTDADREWHRNIVEKLEPVIQFNLQFENPSDEQAVKIKDYISDKGRSLTKLQNDVRSQKRNLNRRKKTPQEAVEQANEMHKIMSDAQSLLKTIQQKTFSGDDAMNLMITIAPRNDWNKCVLFLLCVSMFTILLT